MLRVKTMWFGAALIFLLIQCFLLAANKMEPLICFILLFEFACLNYMGESLK